MTSYGDLEVQDSDGIADSCAAIAHQWYKIQFHSNFKQEEHAAFGDFNLVLINCDSTLK